MFVLPSVKVGSIMVRTRSQQKRSEMLSSSKRHRSNKPSARSTASVSPDSQAEYIPSPTPPASSGSSPSSYNMSDTEVTPEPEQTQNSSSAESEHDDKAEIQSSSRRNKKSSSAASQSHKLKRSTQTHKKAKQKKPKKTKRPLKRKKGKDLGSLGEAVEGSEVDRSHLHLSSATLAISATTHSESDNEREAALEFFLYLPV